MYKADLLFNMEREIILLKQLVPFIEEKDLNFKPTENVRTTYELMQYTSTIGAYMMRWLVKNDITDEVRAEIKEYRASLTISNFSERLDKQLAEIKEYMALLTEEDLMQKEVTLPTRETLKLGNGIINCAIKWLTAYRMELFVYLKINGHSTLSTREAWTVVQPA